LLFYYLEPDVLSDIDTALYFTTSTFTTVGYGDIVLPPAWRLLAASTSINGMIIFGWSTAFIFEVMTALYKPSDKNRIQYDRH
jgi:voltage-gated potassium channel Kch